MLSSLRIRRPIIREFLSEFLGTFVLMVSFGFVLRPVSTETICSPSVFSDGCCQPSVGREGTNRVRWLVSKKPVSTKSILLTCFSLPFDVRQGKTAGPLLCIGLQVMVDNTVPWPKGIGPRGGASIWEWGRGGALRVPGSTLYQLDM